jgi:hypothetical protein
MLQQTLDAWRNVYLLAAVIISSGAISFLIFGTADVQFYNDPNWRDKRKREIEMQTAEKGEEKKKAKF